MARHKHSHTHIHTHKKIRGGATNNTWNGASEQGGYVAPQPWAGANQVCYEIRLFEGVGLFNRSLSACVGLFLTYGICSAAAMGRRESDMSRKRTLWSVSFRMQV